MSSDCTPELRERIENTIRFLAVDAVEAAKSGHPGAPMGLAAAGLELFDSHLRFDPGDPDWPLRDRFVLSGGHASMLLYSLLHLFGYDLPLEQVKRFRQLGSSTPGHPEYGDTPGVEVTTGPLGQGFAHAVGMALAGRLTRAQLGGPADEASEGPGNHFVYGCMGDGDMMEGLSSEAASLAGHLGLGNLIFLYDDNHITIDGPTSLCFGEDVPARFAAQGWHVHGPIDGQAVDELASALEAAREETDRPSLIVLRTLIGRGSPAVEGKNKAHGAPLGPEEVVRAKQNMGWPEEPTFLVPDDVRAYCVARAEAKKQQRRAVDARHQVWREANPERAAAWDAARNRKLPANLGEVLAEGLAGVDAATRKHSGSVLRKLNDLVPYLVGGSADLAGSAAPPVLEEIGVVGPGAEQGVDPFAGRNIHFGVREHAMAAITNGIALDGTFRPYSGTFLIFSDYMRPAIRLAALMKIRSFFVFTHDSFYVGEDGPTHQPIEQLDSLRAIPGLSVFRPADGIETALAYAWILQEADGPAMLSLTRQTLPALERSAGFEPGDVWKGAYAVRDPGGKPDLVLIASGSEVSLACETADLLSEQGLASRVVSMPCMELFLEQPESDQLALVPDDGTLVVAVEAGRGESYRRFVGRRGLVYGLDRFGASAPAKDLAKALGFTADQVAQRIVEHRRRAGS
ncbi:MAG: transketolase [Deltaproteobacteria bacterium]|nr:transketolase [Deltaproteobacteria bacterium]